MLAFWLYGFFSTSIDAHFTCDSSRCKAENDQPTTLPFNPLFSRLHRYTGWCDVYHVKCTRVHQEMITPFHFIGHDGGDGDVDGGNGDNTSTLSTLQGALPDGGQWVRTFRVTSLPTSDPGHLLRFYLNVILEMRFHRLYCLSGWKGVVKRELTSTVHELWIGWEWIVGVGTTQPLGDVVQHLSVAEPRHCNELVSYNLLVGPGRQRWTTSYICCNLLQSALPCNTIAPVSCQAMHYFWM